MIMYHNFAMSTIFENKAITIYSTDSEILRLVRTHVAHEFKMKTIHDFVSSGEKWFSPKDVNDIKKMIFCIERFLCFHGWEPYERGRFRLKFETQQCISYTPDDHEMDKEQVEWVNKRIQELIESESKEANSVEDNDKDKNKDQI